MAMIRLFKSDLVQEIRTWADKGIISTDQAQAICREYGVDYHAPGRRGYYILAGLGYFFLGLTVITLVASNWEAIPRGARMAGLIAATLIIQLLGLLRYRRGDDRAAVGLFFLGSILYGASIMLIAQIYHIGEHYPDGVLYWALGVLPLGLVIGSRLVTGLAAALAFIWMPMEAGLGYFPWLFPLFLAALVWFLSAVKPSRLLFLAVVVGLGFFLEYSLGWMIGGGYRFEFGPECLVLAWGYFLVLHGGSRQLILRPETDLKDYGGLVELWSLRFFLLVLLILGFEGAWDVLFFEPWHWPWITLALALAAGACHVALGAGNTGHRLALAGAHAVSLVLLYGVLFPNTWAETVIFQVVANLAMVGVGTALIIQGIRKDRSHYYFLGIAGILLTGLFRYMDLIGDYLGTALLFAGCALILLLSARYWKQRHDDSNQEVGHDPVG